MQLLEPMASSQAGLFPWGLRCSLAAFRCSAMQGIRARAAADVHVAGLAGRQIPGRSRSASESSIGTSLSRRIPESNDNKWNKANLGEPTKPFGWEVLNSGGHRPVRCLENSNSFTGKVFTASLCLMYGLIECLFLFLQFWLVDHTRSHWPAGWPLAFLASWHCSTDDESFQEPHLSAQWQTLSQLPPPHPPTVLFLLSSLCRALLSSPFYPSSISSVPAWLNGSTGPSSVPLMLSSSLFAPDSLTAAHRVR